MRVLSWISRILIFLVLLAFALKNADPVRLRFLFDIAWQTPLSVVALIFFAAGAVLGALSLLGPVLRLRREVARLRRGKDTAPTTPAPATQLPSPSASE